jgi:oxygen-independent coproporphyrinogen-3 oxidase
MVSVSDSDDRALGLYVHLPWCARKCPYCDFNSHEVRDPRGLAQRRYLRALLADLDVESARAAGRTVSTIFLGGGTPSLFEPDVIADLLDGARRRLAVAGDAEVTLEANPGSVEAGRFRGYREAGVNRLSLGVQSFDDRCLAALGRIHDGRQARAAVDIATSAGYDHVNIDLMFGLPGQDTAGAVADIEVALANGTRHVSTYQLTIEPNTVFYKRPPVLPDDDACWAMQEAIGALLAGAGLERYEVSAWAAPDHRCRHNLNYWRFGDYLGIGAGAHGKLTTSAGVIRRHKRRQPESYMAACERGDPLAGERTVGTAELVFEFMLNALRLADGFTWDGFERATGLARSRASETVAAAVRRGWLDDDGATVRPTEHGYRFLNDVVALFLPEGAKLPVC